MRRMTLFFAPSVHLPLRLSAAAAAPNALCACRASASDKPGARASKRPYGYWKHREHIHKELNDYLQTVSKDDAHIMPTERQLVAAGRKELAGAIRRHSTWREIAAELDLVLSSVARPRGLNLIFCTKLRLRSGRMRPYMFWREFGNVEEEVRQFMRARRDTEGRDGSDDVSSKRAIPTAAELERAGRSDLIRAIGMHGGWERVAEQMQLREHRRSAWGEFAAVQTEIERIIADGKLREDMMPSLAVLKRDGARGLYSAVVRRHGGATAVAKRMGLTNAVERKPRGYWACAQNRRREVEDCVRVLCERRGDRDAMAMPTRAELKEIGRTDVTRGVMRYGGFRAIAGQLGLCVVHDEHV